MQPLSPEGERTVGEIAQRYGISTQAVTALLQAVVSGGGTMAQFSIPELGGMGQWTQGGMTMVGDMFNYSLKAKVDGLCGELSGLLRRDTAWTPVASFSSQMQSQGVPGAQGTVSLFVPSVGGTPNSWWGADLGVSSSAGSQNHIRYAFFPGTRRLAIGIGDQVTIYDTGDHQIGGVSQQQGGDASLTFTSQYGLVRVAELPIVSPHAWNAPLKPVSDSPWASGSANAAAVGVSTPSGKMTGQEDDVFAKLEQLAELHKKGIVSEQEFAAKKADLLGRL